jgi:methylenetetrahydrofolate dehydrogenase (NADP+)/methenyltetrahydrofolate cyclohydrolase
MAIKIGGKKIADSVKSEVKREIGLLRKKGSPRFRLAAVQIGRYASADLYINSQQRLASELGIDFSAIHMDSRAKRQKAEDLIDGLNKDGRVTGIILQRPVPKHIDFLRLCERISPSKDAEGLHPVNMGRLLYGNSMVVPCTAGACMKILGAIKMELQGKEIVIIGHSEIVGKPLSLMLLSRLATTTVCHIGTYKRGLLKEHVNRAEILIVSVGKAGLIPGSWIRKGATVIDVGINKVHNRVVGDVDFTSASKRASYITPVPGGVGPITSVLLMKNVVALGKKNARVPQ